MTFANLCATFKSLCSVAEPALYSHYDTIFGKRTGLDKFCRSVLEVPRLAKHIRELSIHGFDWTLESGNKDELRPNIDYFLQKANVLCLAQIPGSNLEECLRRMD